MSPYTPGPWSAPVPQGLVLLFGEIALRLVGSGMAASGSSIGCWPVSGGGSYVVPVAVPEMLIVADSMVPSSLG